MTMLEADEINTYYDKSHVLYNVSLEIPAEGLVTLIGRNGAGKTTTLRSIMGIQPPRSGTVTMNGEDITDASPHETSLRGISIIPEGRRIFADLTVRENLRLGHLGHDIEDIDGAMVDIFEYFPRLEERQQQRAGTMSGGEQQMLTIARGLLSDPDLLLVDEPTEGLMPSLVERLRDILGRINDDGVAMLLVEQNAELALDISDYGYIIDEGRIRESGPSEELRADEEIKDRYLAV
ncbi:ABC transporter ATP-binding protein [Haladaptatus halobius]|uniref:ABC transporter ATP-binding protein n=1 Tax=Haladaptatus halobius TaxID=2884875 RepID=UPI001D0B0F30|nr:ABC transporter ATP-binding protein [Haladaptatus halobius]